MSLSPEIIRHIKYNRSKGNEKAAFALEGMLARVKELKGKHEIEELPPEAKWVIKLRVLDYSVRVKTNNGKESILDIQARADELGVDVSTLIRMPVGAVIKAWREVLDLRLEDLSRRTGVSLHSLSMWEHRLNTPRNPAHLTSTANALGITVEDIKNGRLPDGVTIRFVPARTLAKSLVEN